MEMNLGVITILWKVQTGITKSDSVLFIEMEATSPLLMVMQKLLWHNKLIQLVRSIPIARVGLVTLFTFGLHETFGLIHSIQDPLVV